MIPPIEEQILEWANENNYKVDRRIWRQILKLTKKLTPKKSPSELLEEMSEDSMHKRGFFTYLKSDNSTKALKILRKEGPSFERNIYLPTGIFTYQFSDLQEENRVDTENDLEKFLKDKNLYFTNLAWHLGQIDEWNQMNEKEVENTSLINGNIRFSSRGDLYSEELRILPKNRRKYRIGFSEYHEMPTFPTSKERKVDDDYVQHLLQTIATFNKEQF
jgi:hypothetical protein